MLFHTWWYLHREHELQIVVDDLSRFGEVRGADGVVLAALFVATLVFLSAAMTATEEKGET